MWLTTADESQKLAPQSLQPSAGQASGDETVTIDTSRHFQKMHGFGAAITDASAQVLSALPNDKRKAIMTELFGRTNGGLGLSFTRLTVGASDFSSSHYTYDDSPGNAPDPELRHFSIEPATKSVLPLTREALAINPDLLVMISPWSAPAWMKTGKNLIKGQLVPQFYQPFANYLARTVEGFGREGVPVAMITIQNEPDFEPGDYPGMRVNSPDRAIIIGRHVGPTFRARGLKTQILEYDHNWDDPQMPLAVLADPVARQLGIGSGLALLRRRCAGPVAGSRHASGQGCLGHRMFGRRMVAEIRRGTRLDDRQAHHRRLQQLVARNPPLEPSTRSGSRTACRRMHRLPGRGDDRSEDRSNYPERQILGLGHASRFVLPGAYRVATSKRDNQVEAAAFLNPDGSRVAIIYRKAGDGPVTMALDSERYVATLPKGSVATLRWSARNGGK